MTDKTPMVRATRSGALLAFAAVPVALFTALSGTPSASASPQFSAELDERVFEFVLESSRLTWDEASAAAAARTYMGQPGRLATIDSQAIHDHVVASFSAEIGAPTGAPWIGGFSPSGSTDPNSGWFWESGEPWGYTNWIPGEPSGWAGDPFEGATINGTVGWNDVPPSVFGQFSFVVEYDVVSFTEPPTKDACKKGGWQDYTDDEGTPFVNQGDCVSYVASGS